VSRLLDRLSEYFAHRKGLLPIAGAVLVAADFLVQLLWPGQWLAQSGLLLHLGILVASFGFLLAWAL
jgi:hypothetical protein